MAIFNGSFEQQEDYQTGSTLPPFDAGKAKNSTRYRKPAHQLVTGDPKKKLMVKSVFEKNKLSLQNAEQPDMRCIGLSAQTMAMNYSSKIKQEQHGGHKRNQGIQNYKYSNLQSDIEKEQHTTKALNDFENLAVNSLEKDLSPAQTEKDTAMNSQRMLNTDLNPHIKVNHVDLEAQGMANTLLKSQGNQFPRS